MDKDAFDVLLKSAKQAQAIAEGKAKPAREHHVFTGKDIKAIRTKLDMSQKEFSEAFRLPVGTVQGWESNRRVPDSTAQALLTVISKKPKAAMEALGA